jgi:hypothetical protein
MCGKPGLLPCPFCGGTWIAYSCDPVGEREAGCGNCNASAHEAWWSIRAPPAPAPLPFTAKELRHIATLLLFRRNGNHYAEAYAARLRALAEGEGAMIMECDNPHCSMCRPKPDPRDAEIASLREKLAESEKQRAAAMVLGQEAHDFLRAKLAEAEKERAETQLELNETEAHCLKQFASRDALIRELCEGLERCLRTVLYPQDFEDVRALLARAREVVK